MLIGKSDRIYPVEKKYFQNSNSLEFHLSFLSYNMNFIKLIHSITAKQKRLSIVCARIQPNYEA